MRAERRFTREDADAFMAQLGLVFASGDACATMRFLGADLLLERDVAGAFTLRGPDADARIYPPTATRPSGYPDDVPFVPNETLLVTNPESKVLSWVWLTPRDPVGLYTDLHHHLVRSGWVPETPRTPGVQELDTRYERGGYLRFLHASDLGVTLVQLKSRREGRGS